MKRLIIGLLLLSMVGVASADSKDTSECDALHERWQEWEKFINDRDRTDLDRVGVGFYLGYVVGWLDINDLTKQPINLPEDFRYKHGLHVVGKWLEDNPEQWHLTQNTCVYRALKEAYGLRKNAKIIVVPSDEEEC